MSKIYLAPAKVNLHLAVTGIDAQQYHELDTSFAYVNLYDRLSIKLDKQLDIQCSKPELSGKNNLVYHVLQALAKQYHIDMGLSVFIDKHIPAQAGLGGGSSDAATALLAACHFWQLELSKKDLIRFASPFGADIPCFLYQQASLATGIGEQLQTLDKVPTQSILLAHPGIGLSTAKVFAAFDQTKRLTPKASLTNLRARCGIESRLMGLNDLESHAMKLCPELRQLLHAMRQNSQQAWMSGSGSCCIALLENSKQAEQLRTQLINSGLARWSHIGSLHSKHPYKATNKYWGVAKR